MRACNLLVPLIKSKVDVSALRVVLLDARDLATIRGELDYLAATLRPGRSAVNAGLTPRWRMERVARLDKLRAKLAAASAAGVGA